MAENFDEISKKVQELEAQYASDKKMIKAVFYVAVFLITAFFGITFATIGTKVNEAIKEEGIQKLTAQIEQEIKNAEDTNQKINGFLVTAQNDSSAIDAIRSKTETDEENLKKIIPKGTVAAFNLDTCPSGWNFYNNAAGRVVVGAGSGGGLTHRSINDSGGEEKHKLTVAELPEHRHQLPTFNGLPGSSEVGSGHHGKDFVPKEFSDYSGKNSPHNNMQPFIVLTYCIKE